MDLDDNTEFKPIETEEEFQKQLFHFVEDFIHEEYPQPFVASERAQEERREICNSCEHRKPLKDKCALCGCPLASKIFACFEKCPDDKWGCDFDGFVETCYNSVTGKLEEGVVVVVDDED